eukprot:TRINITY_DN1283_c0_g1_i2.p1 TRINITY_DN1283_c0_g1~~TRINITY_DN1283_c0_g1_i2.p1  ORF type:complete len:535 (-),score=189.37 TRINITY_DN1283_c0_g1_i2:295-1899(-)
MIGVNDSLNDVDNLKVAIEAVNSADLLAEAIISYNGFGQNEPSQAARQLVNVVELAQKLVDHGAHALCIHDKAGSLKPRSADILIRTLRQAFPNVPIRLRTHNTAGLGVATSLAAHQAGANVVDVSMDAISGQLSEPAIGSIVASVAGTPHDSGISLDALQQLNTYWELTRSLYAPFQAPLPSVSTDVYQHGMTAHQQTRLQLLARSLANPTLVPRFKQVYAQANKALGYVSMGKESSHVVWDLADCMLNHQIYTAEQLVDQISRITLPKSVILYFQGYLGVPPSGFPAALRDRVLSTHQAVPLTSRAGASVPDRSFEQVRTDLQRKHGRHLTDLDALMAVLYPRSFDTYTRFRRQYGRVEILPTQHFFNPLKIGDTTSFVMPHRHDASFKRQYNVKLVSIQKAPINPALYSVQFEINGAQFSTLVRPTDASQQPFVLRSREFTTTSMADMDGKKEKVDKKNKGHIGAPMPGKVVQVKVSVGQAVKSGTPVVVLNSMKMETQVVSPVAGKVARILVKADDVLDASDLMVDIAQE